MAKITKMWSPGPRNPGFGVNLGLHIPLILVYLDFYDGFPCLNHLKNTTDYQ